MTVTSHVMREIVVVTGVVKRDLVLQISQMVGMLIALCTLY